MMSSVQPLRRGRAVRRRCIALARARRLQRASPDAHERLLQALLRPPRRLRLQPRPPRPSAPAAAAAAAAPASGAPATSGPLAAKDGPSLYHRLGGYDGIAAFTDDFLGRATNDSGVSCPFSKASRPPTSQRIRQHLVEQICAPPAAPALYRPGYAQAAHAGAGNHTRGVGMRSPDTSTRPSRTSRSATASATSSSLSSTRSNRTSSTSHRVSSGHPGWGRRGVVGSWMIVLCIYLWSIVNGSWLLVWRATNQQPLTMNPVRGTRTDQEHLTNHEQGE